MTLSHSMFHVSNWRRWLLIGACAPFAAMTIAAADLQLSIAPDRADAMYQMTEPATFTIQALVDGQSAPDGTMLEASFSLDGGKNVGVEQLSTQDGSAKITRTLEQPGFLRCNVKALNDSGNTMTAVAFSPEKIVQGYPEPADFDAFWEAGKAEVSAIDLDTKISEEPSMCTETLNVYRVSFANVDQTRIYGFLSVPKEGDGPFPAVLVIPGASPANNGPGWHALEGAITLFLNVHSYESTDNSQAAQDAAYGVNTDYPKIGASDRNTLFFRRAWLGMYRAVDFLTAQEKWDGKNLGVCGWSQGGGSTLALAGMDHRFTYAVANQPALCDHGAFLQGRVAGWPWYGESLLEPTAYVDVANFARRIQCPVVVLVGFTDDACHPGSVYAAYNNIPAGKKSIINEPDTRHCWNDAYTNARNQMMQFFQTADDASPKN